jgi:predicted NBD/HSP70 family sugar kinase
MMNARSASAGLKHQKEKRSMAYFAGLDVSVKETSVCIVDDAGKIVREARVASEPEALLQVLANTIYRFKASWAGSWTAIAVALQHSRRSGLASDLC